MIRAFQMIFAPEGAWLNVAEKNRHFLFTLFLSTLPLLASALALECFGMLKYGETTGDYGLVRISQEVAVKYGITHLVLDLAFLFGGSWFLLSVARSFNSPSSFSQAFNTMAVGVSPIFLMHALDGIPQLHTWLCWGVGAGLSIRALYHGVAVVIKPEQTKGFGLYVVSIFIVGFLSALSHFISIAVLHGKTLQ